MSTWGARIRPFKATLCSFAASPSGLRKLADNELDPKYEAVKVSRKQLQDLDDEESEDDDEEIEAVMNAEEELLIAEPGDGVESDAEDEDEDDEEEDDSEDEATPRRSFQARLEQMRASTRKDKGKGRATEDSSDEAMSIRVTWEDGEEEWLDSIDVRSSWNLRILLC